MRDYTKQVEEYFSFSHFIKFYKKASSSNDKNKIRINMYGFYLEIKERLLSGKFKPLHYKCFYVKDPNPREIFAPSFADRIIHHLIVSILYPIDDFFIDNSYANRKGKGTHKAIKKLQYFMRQYPQRDCFYLQMDIQNCFMSINKYILFKLIFKQLNKLKLSFENKDFIVYLLNSTILHDPTKNVIFSGDLSKKNLIPSGKSLFNQPKHKGLTSGSLTSQFEALVYLNELDWFVINELKIDNYIRYVDDFIIIDNGTKRFEFIKEKIANFLESNLEMKLHPKKIKCQNVSKGIDSLGYIIRPHYLLVRKRTINTLKNKLRFFNWLINPNLYKKNTVKKDYDRNSISKNFRLGLLKEGEFLDLQTIVQMLQVINSYYGIFSFANSYNLRRFLYDNHFEALKEFFIPKNSFRAFILKPNIIKLYAKGIL